MERRVPYQNKGHASYTDIKQLLMLKGILRLKPYGVKELCYLYEITDKTLKRWLKPFMQDIGTRNGHYYNVIQVEIIFTKLGLPRDVESENFGTLGSRNF